MSCGAVSPKDSQTFQRAVRKIKCAGVVANLAKGWQGWAKEHSERQDSIPSGWMPSSVEDSIGKGQKNVVKLTVTPRVITADDGEKAGSQIRSCSVTKTVQPKRSECSSIDLVNAIRDKMESGPEESKPYPGGESPTRRRHMRALQEGGGGGVIQERKLMLQEKKLESRSSSVDTEDSGLGEENGLSDHGESKAEPEEVQPKKQTNRPKVKRRFSLSHEGSGGVEGVPHRLTRLLAAREASSVFLVQRFMSSLQLRWFKTQDSVDTAVGIINIVSINNQTGNRKDR